MGYWQEGNTETHLLTASSTDLIQTKILGPPIISLVTLVESISDSALGLDGTHPSDRT